MQPEPLQSGVQQSDAAGVPMPFDDRVALSVTAPTRVVRERDYVLDVWVHTEERRNEVRERAQATLLEERLQMRSRSGVLLDRGDVLHVHVEIDGFELPDPAETMIWTGDIGNASFAFRAPKGLATGSKHGRAELFAGELRVARLDFVIEVGHDASDDVVLKHRAKRYKTAFASYASADRDEVLGRIQGMQKVSPDLDVFLDVASLRSGEDWELRLMDEIANRDVLYLFWSPAASRSTWVDREWRTGLRERGIQFIDPVPLVTPREAPPPEELRELHFNDWMLAFRR